jgi:hypothetical protein
MRGRSSRTKASENLIDCVQFDSGYRPTAARDAGIKRGSRKFRHERKYHMRKMKATADVSFMATPRCAPQREPKAFVLQAERISRGEKKKLCVELEGPTVDPSTMKGIVYALRRKMKIGIII